jgi:hypothetical protein
VRFAIGMPICEGIVAVRKHASAILTPQMARDIARALNAEADVLESQQVSSAPDRA